MTPQIYSELTTTIANEEMLLLSEKGIYLPEHRTLLIADLHFGKIEHFRKNGIPLPAIAGKNDFLKLKNLILKVDPVQVIFLGDLFHSEYNDAWLEFQEVITSFSDVAFHLVLGNHDILDHSQYQNLLISYQMELGNLILTHEPMDIIMEEKYNLCGHIHPGVRLQGRSGQSTRIPCFYFSNHLGILPSFGEFTGTHVIKPMKGDQVYVVQENIVLCVT